MQSIKAKFKGQQNNLDMFLRNGVVDYSSKFLGLNTLIVEWFVDEENKENAKENCMGLINTYQMELWNIDLDYIE